MSDSLSEVEGLKTIVLLVDDQPMIGEAIRRALMSELDIGYHYCSKPMEAVSAAVRIKPTVILQDLVMPEISGFDLLRQYRENPQTKEIPVIILSSEEDPNTKRGAFEAMADDYLVKIPDKIELIARIQHHSHAYINRLQLNAAYLALRESQQKLIEMNLELQLISNLDGLTGLSNRRYLDEFIQTEWRRAIREENDFSMLMIDVDNFKNYNDTHGHLAGDEILKKVAGAIKLALQRAADLAARFGGEEFAVVLPATSAEGAHIMAEKIRQNIEKLAIPHEVSPARTVITVSIGVASMRPKRSQSHLILLEAADTALYQAKAAGKNCSIIYTPK